MEQRALLLFSVLVFTLKIDIFERFLKHTLFQIYMKNRLFGEYLFIFNQLFFNL